MDEPIEEIDEIVTLKITTLDHNWVLAEQKRLKRVTKHKPTQAELFAAMREAYRATLDNAGSSLALPIDSVAPGARTPDTETLKANLRALQRAAVETSVLIDALLQAVNSGAEGRIHPMDAVEQAREAGELAPGSREDSKPAKSGTDGGGKKRKKG